jgi:uncharacterized protein YjlB
MSTTIRKSMKYLALPAATPECNSADRKARTLALKAGDVAILPAGTAHQCVAASKDFLVVGAYPASGTYDECRTSSKERDRALTTIPKVGRPRKDPVYGKDGPLLQAWRRIKRAKRVSARR